MRREADKHQSSQDSLVIKALLFILNKSDQRAQEDIRRYALKKSKDAEERKKHNHRGNEADSPRTGSD